MLNKKALWIRAAVLSLQLGDEDAKSVSLIRSSWEEQEGYIRLCKEDGSQICMLEERECRSEYEALVHDRSNRVDQESLEESIDSCHDALPETAEQANVTTGFSELLSAERERKKPWPKLSSYIAKLLMAIASALLVYNGLDGIYTESASGNSLLATNIQHRGGQSLAFGVALLGASILPIGVKKED